MNTFRIRVTLLGVVMFLSGLPCRGDSIVPGRWTKERANAWYAKQTWLVGCNFIPSTACNQLEMWQTETFDAASIDREVGFAERLGFTSVRVFLHDLLWLHDREGLVRRVDQFLGIAQKHKISIMLVLFDSCWNPLPKAGPQPEPRPRTHNAGWAQSPSIEVLKNPAAHPHLRDYVTGIISRFKDDRRIQVWDVWNEPGNFDGGSAKRPGLEPKNKPELVRPLLEQVFAWAREANPSQPLTSAPWAGPNDDAPPNPIEAVQLSHSDVISFHFYGRAPDMERRLKPLRKLGRPILCTECVGRIGGGQFDPIYGFLKQQRIGAYCWGFVAGRTQTIYPPDSWLKPYTAEPSVWCCDLLRADGTPFRQEEVDYIRRVAGRE
jgi:hypothetical protein